MARPLRGAGRLNRLRLSGPESRDAIGEMTFMPERNSSVHVRLPRSRLRGSDPHTSQTSPREESVRTPRRGPRSNTRLPQLCPRQPDPARRQQKPENRGRTPILQLKLRDPNQFANAGASLVSPGSYAARYNAKKRSGGYCERRSLGLQVVFEISKKGRCFPIPPRSLSM